MGSCSTHEELERFLHHRLDSSDGAITAAHVEACASCQELLEQITARPRWQAGQQRTAVREEEWIAGVLERVKAKGPNPAHINEEDRRNRDRDEAQSFVDEPRMEARRAEARAWSSTRPCPEIEGFRIIREIGRGGMGVVYEAEEQNLSRRVAVKILPANTLEDRHQIRRFEREAKAAGRLHHTNIVPVFGVGQSQGNHYYVMQYIDGRGLDVVIDELAAHSDFGRAYFHSVARIGLQAAEALEYANRQGVLHRDIKPSNLLLDGRGNVWVADFGLALTTDADDLTQSGQVLGTFRYMAPERFRGQCDVRADVYSLGLTLYELVALRAAFGETDRFELIERIQREEPARLRRLNGRIPRDLETVIHKAIAHEPAQRYATAAALADDLRRFLRDEPVLARRIGPVRRASKWAKRHPWQTISASLLLGTLTTLAGFFSWHNVQLRAEVARTKAKDAQSRRNYEEARSTIQAMLGRLYDQRVQGVPRLLDLKREFRQDALGFYDRILSGVESNDPVVRADTARALNEASMLQIQVQNNTEAEKLLGRCLRLVDGLLAEKPGEIEYVKIKADCLIKLGPCKLYLGKLDQALSLASQAIEMAERLVAADQGDVSRLELLAVCYQAYGNALQQQKRTTEARKYFRQAIEVRSRIDPSQLPGVTVRLAHALINEGLTFWQEQQSSQAEAVFRRAEQVLLSVSPVVGGEYDSIDVALGQLYVNWGGMLHTFSRFAEAITRADTGLSRVEPFLRNEPNDGFARDVCLKLHGNRGYALMGLEKHRESAAEWDRVLELSPHPVPPVYRVQMAIELLKAGEVARALTQARLLQPGPDVTGADRYNLGCVFALAARAIRDESRLSPEERVGLEKSHIETALFWLKSAAEAGVFKDPAVCDQARKDRDLAILVERDEFRGIIGPPGVKF